MIIASDLDRTLIYSSRALEQFGRPQEAVLKPVESRQDQWTAYMTNTAFFSLQKLLERSMFIPITTRTTEQFNRITLFKGDIPLPYAITANGAVILKDGKPLDEWQDYILHSIKNETSSQEELHFNLQSKGIRLTGQLKNAGSLFFYYILDALPSVTDRERIQAVAAVFGWVISLQGRKLYFIPKCINKGAALEFICKRAGLRAIAGAGDSILDWDFLKSCYNRFVPKHGELHGVSENKGLTVTKQSGILAGEEIIRQFLKLLE